MENKEYDLQVEKEHYFSSGYNHKSRWSSFFYQIKLITDSKAKKILEIGPGNGWVARILEDFGLQVSTVDIDQNLKPDYVAHVEDLPIEDNQYDAVVAFEVLEHLPFEKFVTNLKEMARVSNQFVIISLPDHRRILLHFSLKIPFLKYIDFFIKIPSFKEHIFDGQHYWEIGKNKYSVGRIKNAIRESGLILRKNFVPSEIGRAHV